MKTSRHLTIALLVLIVSLTVHKMAGFRDRRRPLSACEAGILLLSWLELPRLATTMRTLAGVLERRP
jgi:hypothetical protein